MLSVHLGSRVKMERHLVISAKIILVVMLGVGQAEGYTVKSGPLLTKRRKSSAEILGNIYLNASKQKVS